MAVNAFTENRSAERSPSGKRERGRRGGNRGRRPAKQRVDEHSRDRTELWHRGDLAAVREQSAGIPFRSQVAQLTEAIGTAFEDVRDSQAGETPSTPRQPETMHERNTRRRRTKRRQWRGDRVP